MKFSVCPCRLQVGLYSLVVWAMLPLFFLAGMGSTAGGQTAVAGGTISLGGGFSNPYGVAVDGSGNVFVADTGDGTVNEILAAGGYSTVVTLASGFNGPIAVAVDGVGNVFVADYGNNAVKEILAAGGYATVKTLGSGFYLPSGVAVDGSGNVFVADSAHDAIKEILAAGGYTTVNTLASGFYFPSGVAVDGGGNVFVADYGNNAIKEILAVGGYTTVNTLGSGFSSTDSVAVDSNGNVFVADSNNNAVKEILAAGGYTTVNTLGSGFSSANGVAVDSNGNVFVADSNNNAVEELVRSATNFHSVNVGTTSGTVAVLFTVTGTGTFGTPAVLTQGVTGLDFAYVPGGSTCSGALNSGDTCTVNVSFTPTLAGARKGAVELLDGNGAVLATAYLYGTGVGPLVTFQQPGQIPLTLGGGFTNPTGVAVDGAGNVYVANTNSNAVKKMAPGCSSSGCVATLAGGFASPTGVAVDGAGNVYVADNANNAVKQVKPGCVTSGCVTSVGGGFVHPNGVALDGAGNVYVAERTSGAVKKMAAGCLSSSCVTTLGGGFRHPYGVAVDAGGKVYVADYGTHAVYKMTPDCSNVSCVTSLGGGFSAPYDVAVDASGNVYVTDLSLGTITEMPPGCGSSSCVTALATGYSATGIALDESGNLYIADSGHVAVRELTFGTPPALTFPTATSVGSTDTVDGLRTVTVANVGNADLVLPPPATGTNASIAAGFTLGNSGTCPQLSTISSPYTLASGASCTYQIGFAPVGGGINSGSLILTDNNGNASGSMQAITLQGTGDPSSIVLSPAAGSTLTGSTATFTWSAGAGLSNTQIRVGKTPGNHEYGGLAPNLGSSYTISNLPTDGSTIYVTLYSRINNQWFSKAYTYTAYEPTPVAATIVSPSPSSTLFGTTATFTWSAGTDVSNTQIRVGKTPGNHEYGGLAPNTGSSYTIHNLPADGSTVYVTLYSRIHDQWVSKSYTYVSSNVGPS